MKIVQNIKQNYNGLLAVCGGFLVHLSLGGIYTYGNMSPYIIAYMQNNTMNHPDINPGNSMWIFGLSVFGLGAAMSLGGFIETKIGPLLTVLIGSWIMSFGVIISFYTIKVHLALMAFSYGLIAGVGTGIAYGVALAVPTEWFPQCKGLISGIIVGGFGLGPLVFDFVQLSIINNDATSVQLNDVSKVPISFVIMGSIYICIQTIGLVFIRRPPVIEDEVIANTMQRLESFAATKKPADVDIEPFQLIFELDFWVLWLTFALNSIVLVLVLSLHKVFGQILNFSDLRLVSVSAIGALCNGSGRIFWGYLNDKIGYKELMSVLTLSMSLMLGTFYMCTRVGDLDMPNDNSRYVLYFVWVVLLHLLLSGNFSLFPTMCVKTFGLKFYAKNYGFLFTAYSFAGLATSAVTTVMLANDSNPNVKMSYKSMDTIKTFLVPFLIGSFLSLISGLLTLFYRGKSKLIRKNTYAL